MRESLARDFTPLTPSEEDPIWELVGMFEGDPDGSLSVNEVIYGWRDE